MVKRVYIEKKEGFDGEARRLRAELADFLGSRFPELAGFEGLRVLRRYDVSGLDDGQFKKAIEAVFSEPQCDTVYLNEMFCGSPSLPDENGIWSQYFSVEYLPGQYDQRADSAGQCIELVVGTRPAVKCATVYIFNTRDKALSGGALDAVKKHLINPVDSREASADLPLTLENEGENPPDIPFLSGFCVADNAALKALAQKYGLAMSAEDLLFCQSYFASEKRDPTLAELRVLDTYWSDHCRHTTFNTILEEIDAGSQDKLKNALALYEEARKEVYGADAAHRPRTLMDMATIGVKVLKKRGLAAGLDESKEINACTIKVDAEFSDSPAELGAHGKVTSLCGDAVYSEPWLLLFKNETHNHPTEIEPFGGAATCLGGAIRDPLSGRAFVYQAMRVSGGGDPRTPLQETLPGKLPQIKIAREAASGYSSYGNQVGLATGQVAEFYHPGFNAKRMELGAVIAATPAAAVRREEPAPGDAVILVGGRTGRDGIGGATGSSKVHTSESVEKFGAEVQKGNAVEERKLQRLFRKAGLSRLIKRCNDFGAGGVAVAVGELAAGLDINLDKIPKKYAGLDGTELAISESQERMAVVVAPQDAETFIREAAAENLEATVIATVVSPAPAAATVTTEVTTAVITEDSGARLRMNWRGKTIVNLSRAFLDTNGAPRSAKAKLPSPQRFSASEKPSDARSLLDELERELGSPRSGSRRGLQERFDGSIGAASVLFPWGGSEQGTPECGMAALLPVLPKNSSPKSACLTASLMTFGYDPAVMELNPYEGAKGSVKEALAKFACLGGDFRKAWMTFQEYFARPETGETWGAPAAALLGALEAQLRLGVPAIGGKDSMSGNYRDQSSNINLAVPPTLVAFAAGITPAAKVRSGALSGSAGNIIALINSPAATGDEWDNFAAGLTLLATLGEKGLVKASYPVPQGGVAAGLALMAFGNSTGVEAYAPALNMVNSTNYQGAVLAELDGAFAVTLTGENSPAKNGIVIAGRTIGESVFRILNDENEKAGAEIPLAFLRRSYERPFSQVYPQNSRGTDSIEALDEESILELPPYTGERKAFTKKAVHYSLPGSCLPLAVLPVFPGTNCEWDTERAFQKAGAETRQVVFRNQSKEDIKESIEELCAAIAGAHIIAFSGGFSAGDEPDGSGKFIANVIRSPKIAGAITDFLEKRGGLILGICNGFQALIKTGLTPYGKITAPAENAPTLTLNTIGRHISRMVYTRVMPCASPWLSLETEGSIHVIPISHGEGRVAISGPEARALFAAGQVPFCYADARGNPTTAEPFNPNGSAFAIE
ncbi:MAG: phosphoribosylformylglycinamidine synthase, partial [Treponema sp.]|nr:phosphoribosylformylglycinamidine synthase [Treponema sp.]